MADNLLGDYLRARRAHVTPEAAGIPRFGRRRVPGLRREEVAMKAGVSVDYYVRLEQGRERRPSAQVLHGLADALHLDEDARAHLFRLAEVAPAARRTSTVTRVDPELRRLLGMWPDNPAIVLGRGYDVLASNELADALYGFAEERNLVLRMFLDPASRVFYRDWERVASYMVAGLRLLHGEDPDHPRVNEVIEILLARSTDFGRMWARHDIRRKQLECKRFSHRDVGEVTLWMNVFEVKSAPGQELIVYHAEPDTPSADALRLLGTLVATGAQETR